MMLAEVKESRIGNAPDAGIAVVVRHILQQPVDGVVKIAGVVHVLLGFLVVDVRTHLDKCTLRHVAAAHILEDENVSRLVEVGRGPELLAVQIHAIRSPRCKEFD